MKDSIIKFRSFLLAHIKNPSLQTLIKGLISYEMLTYVFSALVLPLLTTLYLLFLMQVRSVPLLPISSQHFVLSFFLMSQISDGYSKVRPAVLWKFYMSFCALPEPV